jgi:hypothetical protein
VSIGNMFGNFNYANMKKLILLLALIVFCTVTYSQRTSQNITIEKTTPTLFLKGSGGVLNFNNGDVTFTNSSNTLTLAGGNLALGSNSLTLTGSIGATGSRVTKGWFADLEITNVPTINGGSGDTLATRAYARAYGGTSSMIYPGAGIPLSTGSAWGSSITNNSTNWNTAYSHTSLTNNPHSVTATQVSLGNVTNESKATMFTNPTFTGTLKISTTDTVASQAYARAHGGSGGDITALTERVDSVVTVLGDTVLGGTVYRKLADTTTMYTWNVGIGAAGDTALFRKYAPHAYTYGSFFWDGSDTLYVTKLIGKVSSGGSVSVQVSWDVNDEDATPTNLNNSAPTITSSTSGDADVSFNNNGIPPGVWVWLSTPAVSTQPKKLRVSLIGYVKNDTY